MNSELYFRLDAPPLERSPQISHQMKRLLIRTLVAVSIVMAAAASHSNPPKIQIKECVRLGTTSDPSVRVFITPLMRSGIPEEDQIYRVRIVVDSKVTLDKSTLYVGDPQGKYGAETQLKSKSDQDGYHYEFTLGRNFIPVSTVQIIFTEEKGTVSFAKRLVLGSAVLPKPSEQKEAD